MKKLVKKIIVLVCLSFFMQTAQSMSNTPRDFKFTLTFENTSKKTTKDIPFLESQLKHAYPSDYEEKKKEFDTKEKCLSQAEKISIETIDNVPLEALYFDRGSDKLVVMGGGGLGVGKLRNYKEKYAFFPFNEYKGYDVLIFDYRWVKRWFSNWNKTWNPLENYWNTRVRDVKNDVISIVQYLLEERKKSYTDIIGTPVCYSTFAFLKAQLQTEKEKKPLFTKLILECPLDRPSKLISFLVSKLPFVSIASKLPLTFFFPNDSVKIEKLKCKNVLLINDTLDCCSRFGIFWNKMKQQFKLALHTPFEHGKSYSSSRRYKSHVHRHICNEFIKAKNTEEFKENICKQIAHGMKKTASEISEKESN